MDRYLYINIHEILLFSFLIELFKWIAKLANNYGWWRLDSPIVWTSELVLRLEASKEMFACTVDHWLDRVIGGFVTEFSFDSSVHYNEAVRCFFKGLQGKYLRSLNAYIKMLLGEKQVMQLL